MVTRVCVGFSVARGLGGLVSATIRLLSKSPASHAWVLFFDPVLECWLVLEAHQTGYRAVPYDIFCRKNKIVKIYQLEHDLGPGLAEAARWLGSHYDFAGLLGMGVVMLGRALKRRWRNPLRSSRSQFCSEAVARVLKAAKYPGSDMLRPDDCDPRQLLSFLATSGKEWQPEV